MTALPPRRGRGAASSLGIVCGVAAVALVVSGCGAGDDPTGTAGGRLDVVASTDVWGSVVAAVGGDAVALTTLVDDPAADPHGYESSPSDAAAVLGADLVVFNGGGYDEFVSQILESDDGDVPAVEAVTAAGGEHAGGNEHVWYDLATVDTVAGRVAAELGRLAPAQAGEFSRRAGEFGHRLDGLRARVSSLRQQHAGTPVAVTEPVAFHLIEATGLADATPPDFVEAVEEGTDPPAAAVAQARRLVAERRVAALVFNPQTRTPVTAQLRAGARRAGIPVVEMTETMPAATGYVDWMSGQVGALERALR